MNCEAEGDEILRCPLCEMPIKCTVCGWGDEKCRFCQRIMEEEPDPVPA